MAESAGATGGRAPARESELQARIEELEAQVGHLRLQLSQQDLFEQALVRSQTHLRNLLDSLFVFIIVMQPDGTVLKANRAPLETAGLTLDDVLGVYYPDAPWWNASPQAVGQIRDAVRRAQAGDSTRFDITVTTKTGKPLTLDLMLSPMFDEEGEITRLISCGVDISDRVRFERALFESESRFRSTFENAAVGMAQLALNGRLLAVNDKLCAIFGYTRQELISLSFRELSHPDDSGAHITLPESLLAHHNQTYTLEKRYIRKDGSTVWANVTASPALNAEGEPEHLIAVVEDITARKRAELALRESERKFRTLADGIPQLAWMADASGSIYWYNQRWYDYSGTTPEQMLGWGWKSVHDPAELPRVLEQWQSALARGERFEMVFPLRGGDGVFRPFLTRAIPVRNHEEQIVGWFGTNTDITDQKRTEDALRRSNSDLEQFAYIASHDLQEPVRTVATLTQLLERRAFNGLDEQSREWMRHIVASAKRMGTLIADLLAYSRATLEGPGRSEPVDCNALAVNILAQFQTEIAETGAVIEIDALPVVTGNPMQLAQVFHNLISNALRFTRPGHAPQIRISATRRDLDWLFSVSDRGQGFDPVYAGRVFGIFKRLHGTDVPGNGIGLAICKTIIARHGGDIWVETAETQGATFFFTLPA